MAGLANLRKILLFGLLGAAGCLAGWLVGEVFLLAFLPTSKEAGGSLASKPAVPVLENPPAPPSPPAPALPATLSSGTRTLLVAAPPPAFPAAVTPKAPAAPPAEFAKRLEDANAKSGDVQITLIWFNVNDLDLHCIDPKGEEIFYAHRRSRSAGELDVDMNAGGPMTNRPVENIYWPKGKAPVGKYKVYVNHYANHGGKDPTEYKVSILAGGDRQEFAGKISSRQPKRLIAEFEVKAPSPDLQVAVSPELVVHPGGKNKLQVRLARKEAPGPVTLRFDGDLGGISPRELTVAANETEATVDLTADESAALGLRTVNVVASAGSAKAEASFQLRVQAPPPELQIAVSPDLIVNQGGRNALRVRIARSNLPGPVRVRIQGDLRGIAARELVLGPKETELSADIQAEAAALPGDRKLTVTASAGDLQADTDFRLTVKKIPPVLRLAVPSEIQVSQGGQNQLPVRIARTGFNGPVTVRLESELTGFTPTEFTIPANRDEDEVTLTVPNDALAVGTHEFQVRATGNGVRARGELHLVVLAVAPTGPRWSWALILVIGLWTALLAIGLSLSLVMGQNWYVSRPLLSVGEVAVLLVGGLLAGVLAGSVGQTLYGLLNQVRLIPEIGFLAGWLLLGSLLGRGVVFFIPNLSAWRATLAGSCGGLLGAIAFIALSFIGDVVGRFTGAAILGFALGLMVAIVETAFRKVWLEVADGPGAVRAVNLGAVPVVIGGDAARCSVLVAGAPGKALKFWEQDGQTYCLDIVAEKTYPVTPGYRHRLKNAEVVVCSNVKGANPQSAPPPLRMPTSPERAIVGQMPRIADLPIAQAVHVAPPPPMPVAPSNAPQPAVVIASRPQLPTTASVPAVGECPVCGDRDTGVPGTRVCSNCSTKF